MSESFQKLVAALAASGDVKFLIDHPELAEYIKVSTVDSTLFHVIDDHVSKYGKIPAKEVVVKEWGEALAEWLIPLSQVTPSRFFPLPDRLANGTESQRHRRPSWVTKI
jgi:hypothetical protein